MQNKGNITKWISKYGPIILIGILTFLHCVICAYTAYPTVDFVAINGTYQNYNPIYRLLSGQIPYRDYACYLGYGPTFLGTFFTMIFGGDYAASLLSMQLLCLLSVWLVAFVIGYAVLGGKGKAFVISAFLINLRIVLEVGFFTKEPFFFNDLRNYLQIYIGHSARLVRGMILPISVILILFGNWIIDKIENQFTEKVIGILRVLMVSYVASCAFIFSSDFGIGSWVCISLMILIATFIYDFKVGQTLKVFIGYLLSFAAFLFLNVSILTGGQFSAWVSGIAGNGSYQRWYYIPWAHDNSYIWNLDYTAICMIALALTCIYLLLFLWNRKNFSWALKRYGIMAFLNMTVYAVANEYMLLSGSFLQEMLSAVVYSTLLFEIIRILYEVVKKYTSKDTLKVVVTVTGILLVLVGIGYKLVGFYNTRQAQVATTTYVEEFGGPLSNSLYEDITKASEIIGDEPVFSTYASALEVYTEQFQPTGIDYIIHVLGDEKREEYLKTFIEGDFKYVTTISEKYSEWEYWAQNANWFFYRELLENYHPVYKTGYQVIWEKNESGAEHVSAEMLDIQIINNDTNFITVNVTSAAKTTGIAEVEVDFELQKTGSLASKFIFNPTVNIQSPTMQSVTGHVYSSFNLPDKGTYKIPVQIINGQGSVILSSIPLQDTTLHINSAVASTVYMTLSDYVVMTDVVSENGYYARVELNEIFKVSVENASTLTYDAIEMTKDEILVKDNYIYIPLNEAMYYEILNGYEKNCYLELSR